MNERRKPLLNLNRGSYVEQRQEAYCVSCRVFYFVDTSTRIVELKCPYCRQVDGYMEKVGGLWVVRKKAEWETHQKEIREKGMGRWELRVKRILEDYK